MNREVKLYPSKRHWLILLPGFLAIAYSLVTGIKDGTALSGPHGPQTFFFAICFIVVFPIAVLIDVNKILVRKNHISMNSYGLVDEFSRDQLGSIPWDVVDALSVQRQLLGASLYIKFKAGAKRQDGTLYPETASIGTLEVSNDQIAVIRTLWNRVQVST